MKNKLIGIFVLFIFGFIIFFALFGESIIKNKIRTSFESHTYQCRVEEKTSKVSGAGLGVSKKSSFIIINLENNESSKMQVSGHTYMSYNKGDIITCIYYYDTQGVIKLIEPIE